MCRGGFQHRFGVVNKECASGLEVNLLPQLRPETGVLLGYAEIMGREKVVEMPIDTGLLKLDFQAMSMGVRDQYTLNGLCAQMFEKIDNFRPYRNKVLKFLFQSRNIHGELLRPVVRAIPLNGMTFGVEASVQLFDRRFRRDPVLFGVAGGQKMLPELVIKMQVQKGAIHIQQDGINGFPVYHGG